MLQFEKHSRPPRDSRKSIRNSTQAISKLFITFENWCSDRKRTERPRTSEFPRRNGMDYGRGGWEESFIKPINKQKATSFRWRYASSNSPSSSSNNGARIRRKKSHSPSFSSVFFSIDPPVFHAFPALSPFSSYVDTVRAFRGVKF